MKLYSLIIAAALTVMCIDGLAQQKKQKGWLSLFNGKDLTGWDTYLAAPRDSAGKKLGDTPLGLNNDPGHVFTVTKEDGESVIHVSGLGLGAVFTQGEYENYHLQLMFKWGTFLQTSRKKKDSGLLYHSVGPQGADSGAWMRSQEFQIEEGDCGDYWGCAGGMADVPTEKKSEKEYIYNPGDTLRTFSAGSKAGRHCTKRGDAENPIGQWNTLDLYCFGDTSVQVVNGKVMMVLYHNRQMDNGQTTPLVRGKIQLQCEGAEVFYKQIRIQQIAALPKELLNN